MSSFFTRKKAVVIPPALTKPNDPSVNVSSQSITQTAATTLPSITASPPPSASPISQPSVHQPYSPISPSPFDDPINLALCPTGPVDVNVKKVKKKSLLSKLFTSKPKDPKEVAAQLAAAPSKDGKSKKSMLSIFRRKTKKKLIVKNERGEDEEREISVSVTVSRIPRALDEDDDGLGATEVDDVLIYPIFGVPLVKIFEVKAAELGAERVTLALPKQIIDVCEYIRFTGLKNEGLFRVSGESASIKEMKEKLDRGEELELTREQLNPHDLTGLFKLYWRSLPEPLFPFSAYDELLHAVDEKDWTLVSQLVDQFPEPNRTIVDYLVSFLGEVAIHGDSNRMTPMNLAVVFAPNLMRMKEERVDRVMTDAPKIIGVIRRLIEVKCQAISDERAREDAEEKAKLEAEAQMAQQTRTARAQAEAQAKAMKASEAQAAIEAEMDEMRMDGERREQEAREAAARAKAKAFAQAQIEKRRVEEAEDSSEQSNTQSNTLSPKQSDAPMSINFQLNQSSTHSDNSNSGSRDENSQAPFSFQLTITGDDGNQTTIGQNSGSIKSSDLPVIEDEEPTASTFTIHNANPNEDPDEIVNMMTGLSFEHPKPASDNRPEWAHHTEERKRLDEIAKLEASLRDRAAEAQRIREQTEQSRMSQLQKEKEAAKSKLSHAQPSNNQSSHQSTNRTELEIVAERVTNKSGEGEQDYWQQIY